MITVLVVDDHATVRAGLRLILESAPDIEVVGEAADGYAAIQNCRALRPDVTLMDIRMPRIDGVEATKALHAEGFRVVVLTTYDHDEAVYGAIRAGAVGFLLKTAESSALIAAIRQVVAGGGALAPEVTGRVLAQLSASGPSESERRGRIADAGLTDREIEVLEQIGQGRSNTSIARSLGISVGTTKVHVSRLLTKLGVESRTQAALIARESGLRDDR